MELQWVEKSVSRDVTVLAEIDAEGSETGNFQYWYPDKVVETTADAASNYRIYDVPPNVVQAAKSRWKTLTSNALAGAVAGGVVGAITATIIH